ncbi:MAG TPA: DMT family transporter [Azoarcus sp.]|nr:DMT family transporter [Azoarcus sp.]
MSRTKLPFLTTFSDHTRGLLAAGVVVLCWTGFNIVSRYGSSGTLTPYDVAALRFGVSGLIALPFFFRLTPFGQWLRYLTLALIAGVGYSLFAYIGFSYAPAAHAGIFINGGIPFWTVILVALTAGFHLSKQVFIALSVTTAGLLLIIWRSLGEIGSSEVWKGDLLFLAAACCWAIFGLLGRRWNVSPRTAIVSIAVFSLALYLPVYLIWLPKTMATATVGEIALQGVYQGVIAALVASSMYTYACQTIGVYRASMMLALVPGASALGAWIILGEASPTVTIIGLILVTVGATLSTRR